MPATLNRPALAALSCAAANRNGRYVVVVDEDIDPTNIKEVLWAMMTRVDPPTNIDIIDGCWSTPLDPRMPPEKSDNQRSYQWPGDLLRRAAFRVER